MQDRIVECVNRGIAINDVSRLYKTFIESQQATIKNLKSLYGISNPNSSAQVIEFFQSIADENIIDACVVDGKWTSNKDAMNMLVEKGYNEAVDILMYRRIKKYAESVKSIIDAMNKDGRIRPTVSLGKTNRINYKEPALMNIPKPLLWHIIAPRNAGNILFSVDIKQQEPWILCNMLGIEELKEIFRSGEDLYEAIFMRIFKRKCTKLERNEIKTSWNAMSYGASIHGIKKICRNIDAKEVYGYFNSLREFKDYKNKCFGLAKKNVQKVETYFGTEIYADEYGSRLQRVLMDIPIQGTGADILALLIQHFDEEVEDRSIENEMELYFTRHDELIIEVDMDYVEECGEQEVVDILSDIFEHQIDDWDNFMVHIERVEPAEIILGGNEFEDE